MTRCALLLVALVALALADGLPTPLSGSAADRLYGNDCSQWCFEGSDILQPELFGATSAWCPDSRGCEWRWRMSFVPCSLSLLDFAAEIGPAGSSYATIDPAAAAGLLLACTPLGGGAVSLELRPRGGAPIMAWHYASASCAALLGDLAGAAGAGNETRVPLGASAWFASGTSAIDAAESDCEADRALRADLLPCVQCFRGVDEMALPPGTAWTDVCGSTASACQLEWGFCYDACTGRTSHAAMAIGGRSVNAVVPGLVNHLHVRCAAQRGRAVLALTDAPSIADLDAGGAHAYVVWEYRDADCEALMRAPRRADLFVQRHVALERPGHTDQAGLPQPPSMLAATGLTSGALDERETTSIDGVGADGGGGGGGNDLSTMEVGLIVGLAVTGALCIVGWAFATVLWYRGTYPRSGPGGGAIPLPEFWGEGGGVEETPFDKEKAKLLSSGTRLGSAAEDLSYLSQDHATTVAQDAARARDEGSIATTVLAALGS